MLWLDAVLLLAALLALGGLPPALGQVSSPWTWIALAGSTLTAASAALSAFESTRDEYNPAWNLLPLPAFGLWMAASGIGCFALPDGAFAWGSTLGEAAECLRFLLAISAPLLALILFMLWWVSPRMPGRAMAFGGLASCGAAATILVLVHPHDAALLDLGIHALAILVVLAVSALAAHLPARK
jgi:hypothetical protein